MANRITVIRIVCSIALLFCPVFSATFYALYGIAGVSDMIDGRVARKTGTVSAFGSKLDTAADLVLAAVCLIKLIPALALSAWLVGWTAFIALMKASNIILGYARRKEFVAVHTAMNKVAGILLFLLPLSIPIVDLQYSGALVCAVATLAAIQEGQYIRTN